jgi:hypothetical protein
LPAPREYRRFLAALRAMRSSLTAITDILFWFQPFQLVRKTFPYRLDKLKKQLS